MNAKERKLDCPMPDYSDDYESRCDKLRKRRAKLIAKGLNPRSLKFSRLLHK